MITEKDLEGYDCDVVEITRAIKVFARRNCGNHNPVFQPKLEPGTFSVTDLERHSYVSLFGDMPDCLLVCSDI
jgi:hypothetical protein